MNAEQLRPFKILEQQDAPLCTEFWDGHEALVEVELRGRILKGYGQGKDALVAYADAYRDALHPHFSNLHDALPPCIEELQTWLCLNRGVIRSTQDLGLLVAQRFMATMA